MVIKRIKTNLVFIIILLAAVLCFVMRKHELTVPVVSNPNDRLEFSTEQSVLEQTWQPNIKKIVGVRIPYTAIADFGSHMRMSIYSDDYSDVLVQTDLYQEFKENVDGVLEFRFHTAKEMPGERYRIQLSYESPSDEGAVLIASNSNFSGCSIDKTAYNGAVAFEIVGNVNSDIFGIFAVFFPLLAFSLLFMTAYGRRWEECIGLSVIATGLVLYVSGLVNALMAGMTMVYVLAVISLAAAVYLYNKKNMQVKDLLSPGLFIYILLIPVIILNCHDAWFARVDEYSQWGMAVKDMYYYQSLAKHVNTTVIVPRYPPFSSLIEYYFVHAKGIFSPELVYAAYQILIMSVLMVLFGMARNKKRHYLALGTIMICLPVIFHNDVFNCIMVDPLLAILAAYVLICYYSEDMTPFNLMRILGGLFALTLTKDMGMVIAGLLTMIMMGDRIYLSLRQKQPVMKRLICPFLCALFVIGVFLSWQIYMSIPVKADVSQVAGSGGDQVQFRSTVEASGISINNILGLLRHEDGGYRYQAIKNFLISIFDAGFVKLGSITVSYVDLMILLILLIGLLEFIGFWREEKGRYPFFGILSFFAGMCYALFLELLYLFAFPRGEAVQLVSFERYLSSFIGGVVIALAGLIIQQAVNNEYEKPTHSLAVIVGLTAAIIICTPMQGFIVKNMDSKITEEHIYGYDEIAEAFRSFSAKAENVYFVCNESNGDTYWMLKNTVCPLVGPYSQYNIYASEEAYEEQVNIWNQNNEEVSKIGKIVSCEEWEEKLMDCQYLFIFHPNDVFRESYKSLFIEPDTIGDGTFYQVRQSGGKVTLKYIGKVEVKDYK